MIMIAARALTPSSDKATTGTETAVEDTGFNMSGVATTVQSLKNLPMVRRNARPEAFIEEWGLYAAMLADELDLNSTPATRFGMFNPGPVPATRCSVEFADDVGARRVHVVGHEVDRLLTAPAKGVQAAVDHEPCRAPSLKLICQAAWSSKRCATKRRANKGARSPRAASTMSYHAMAR